MVKLEDARTSLDNVGVNKAAFLKNEQLLASVFCYDLEMDGLDFEDFLSNIEDTTGSKLPRKAADYTLTVENFIEICNN